MSDQPSSTPGAAPNPASTPEANLYAPPAARVDDVVPEGETVLAGRGSRLGAAIIDTIILILFQLAVNLLFGLDIYNTVSPPGMLTMLMLQLLGMAFYLAINYKLLATSGQSIGKKLMNIRIVRTDGSKVDINRILLRRLAPVWIVSAIPKVGPFVAMVDVLFIFRESRKCLHDDIADTIVVKV